MHDRTITLIEQVMELARSKGVNLRLKTKVLDEGDLVVFKEKGGDPQAALATKQRTGKASIGSVLLYHAEVVKEVSQ